MNKTLYTLLVMLWCSGFAQSQQISDAQHLLLNMPANNDAGKMNPDPKAAWFPKAGLGLFIHWGAIAGYGGGDISWCMLANKAWEDGTVTPNFYYSLMDKWNPKHFDANAIMKKAKEAGFQYIVFTTKHHDGYTLWPTKHGDLGTHTKMHSRDFVKEFVTACHKYGLKVGFYYSPPDWWFDRKYRSWTYGGKALLDMDHKPIASLAEKPADHDKKRAEMVAAQVRELLTNYGKIDLLWFDGGAGEISNDEVRKLQPGIVINRRNGGAGDYGDSEGALPAKRFNGWFETCDPVWPDRWWSYSASDTYNDACTVISNLIRLRAWGGNYLANIGPAGDGSIPMPAATAMKEMAVWMKHSAPSVINVTGGNYPEISNVPVTVGENILYAFAFPNHQAALKIGTKLTPQKVILMRTGQELAFAREGESIIITIPPKLRTRMPDAVKISF